MKKNVFFIIFSFLLIGSSHAESIKQRMYGYRYDSGAVSMSDQTYLVCDNCQDDRPTLIPMYVAHSSSDLPLPQKTPAEDNIVNAEFIPSVASEDAPQAKGIQETVRFNFDSAILLPEAVSILDKISTKSPLKLEGYTCSVGTDKYNLTLSQKRAEAVQRYLKKRGISVLSTLGKGISHQYGNKSLNRRVEIYEFRETSGS